jgi:hypothetical protein
VNRISARESLPDLLSEPLCVLVCDPAFAERARRRCTSASRGSSATDPIGASSAGMVDHLVALAQLHLDGVLTLSEFLTVKRRVVNPAERPEIR